MTTQRIGGHLLVECLVAQGVTHAFGVPGESFLAVLDGFHRHADRILELVRSESEVPILILTAYDFAEAEEVAHHRPNYFMNKPFDAQELILQANCLIGRPAQDQACA